ncbi:hypothetical protein [Paenibacillus prosopidis]|uniref:hypothetical protein n=1 Tax=Paenibacillus prosopidis TaxID=630520 RepID=UPI0011C043B4|nr:hypothetical protein [Paenibacillus prosopidis]
MPTSLSKPGNSDYTLCGNFPASRSDRCRSTATTPALRARHISIKTFARMVGEAWERSMGAAALAAGCEPLLRGRACRWPPRDSWCSSVLAGCLHALQAQRLPLVTLFLSRQLPSAFSGGG